ncbi:MAG: DUF2283 domain-containing protein [Chloroflexi bacterium]|nr:DUF2283 domain-containing protein [Chloroflexota bacterium]
MAQQSLATHTLNNVLKAVPYLTRFPAHRLWLDYDDEADVLYISLERPQKATTSKMRDDGVLLRYRGKKLVGVTVFEASKR